MKKPIITLLLLLICGFVYSQSLEVNKKDDFTGNMEKQTSWEKIYEDFSNTIRIRILQTNSNSYINLKMIAIKSSYHINEGDLLMFKFDDGTVLEFPSTKNSYSEIGAGASGLNGSGVNGIDATFKGDIISLLKGTIIKIRIYTSVGYKDFDISKKKSDLIGKTVKLIM